MKSAARFAGRDLDAMKATAKAQQERSLETFKAALRDYQDRECRLRYRSPQKSCRKTLSSGLIFQPCTIRCWNKIYCVSLSLIHRSNYPGYLMRSARVVTLWKKSRRPLLLGADHCRLSQMILDQVFFGVLNEKAGTLEVFDDLQSEVKSTKT